MGKLSGLRVIDLSLFLPGPMVSRMLADQGADVLKIEPPTGDPARDMEPFEAGQSFWFHNLNHGKRFETLDLKSEAGKVRMRQHLASADVLIEGFRPGVMARLGFDYPAVAAINPRIIYCSISAFGQQGSHAHHPAHDLGAQALSGFLSVNDGPDGTPVVPGVPSADMAASLTACSAILMALLGREKTGAGDYVDIAMLDSLLPWCAHVAGDAAISGAPVTSAAQRSLGGAAFYQVYETADGRHITLCGREPKFAKTLLDALGRPDLLPLALAPAGPAQDPLKNFLAETFRGKTRDEWTDWFSSKDVAYAPVLTFAESLHSPLVQERALFGVSSGFHLLAPAIRFGSPAA